MSVFLLLFFFLTLFLLYFCQKNNIMNDLYVKNAFKNFSLLYNNGREIRSTSFVF